MGFLSIIRRWALRDKMPIREISRRTGLSRNTIRKYLRAGTVEPKFKTPKRPLKLDPYADRLSAWLLTETRKSRKARRTVKQMHADLVKLGYDGSYERVSVFARAWREDLHWAQQTTGRGTYVPLIFQPGEAFQFDWSEDWATVGGERIKLQVAHTKLSHSRAFLVRAYPLQTHEMLFDAHWHALPRIQRRSGPRHLRQHEDGGRSCWSRQATRCECAIQGDDQPLRLRARVLQSRCRLGERTGREERTGFA